MLLDGYVSPSRRLTVPEFPNRATVGTSFQQKARKTFETDFYGGAFKMFGTRCVHCSDYIVTLKYISAPIAINDYFRLITREELMKSVVEVSVKSFFNDEPAASFRVKCFINVLNGTNKIINRILSRIVNRRVLPVNLYHLQIL